MDQISKISCPNIGNDFSDSDTNSMDERAFSNRIQTLLSSIDNEESGDLVIRQVAEMTGSANFSMISDQTTERTNQADLRNKELRNRKELSFIEHSAVNAKTDNERATFMTDCSMFVKLAENESKANDIDTESKDPPLAFKEIESGTTVDNALIQTNAATLNVPHAPEGMNDSKMEDETLRIITTVESGRLANVEMQTEMESGGFVEGKAVVDKKTFTNCASGDAVDGIESSIAQSNIRHDEIDGGVQIQTECTSDSINDENILQRIYNVSVISDNEIKETDKSAKVIVGQTTCIYSEMESDNTFGQFPIPNNNTNNMLIGSFSNDLKCIGERSSIIQSAPSFLSSNSCSLSNKSKEPSNDCSSDPESLNKCVSLNDDTERLYENVQRVKTEASSRELDNATNTNELKSFTGKTINPEDNSSNSNRCEVKVVHVIKSDVTTNVDLIDPSGSSKSPQRTVGLTEQGMTPDLIQNCLPDIFKTTVSTDDGNVIETKMSPVSRHLDDHSSSEEEIVREPSSSLVISAPKPQLERYSIESVNNQNVTKGIADDIMSTEFKSSTDKVEFVSSETLESRADSTTLASNTRKVSEPLSTGGSVLSVMLDEIRTPAVAATTDVDVSNVISENVGAQVKSKSPDKLNKMLDSEIEWTDMCKSPCSSTGFQTETQTDISDTDTERSNTALINKSVDQEVQRLNTTNDAIIVELSNKRMLESSNNMVHGPSDMNNSRILTEQSVNTPNQSSPSALAARDSSANAESYKCPDKSGLVDSRVNPDSHSGLMKEAISESSVGTASKEFPYVLAQTELVEGVVSKICSTELAPNGHSDNLIKQNPLDASSSAEVCSILPARNILPPVALMEHCEKGVTEISSDTSKKVGLGSRTSSDAAALTDKNETSETQNSWDAGVLVEHNYAKPFSEAAYQKSITQEQNLKVIAHSSLDDVINDVAKGVTGCAAECSSDEEDETDMVLSCENVDDSADLMHEDSFSDVRLISPSSFYITRNEQLSETWTKTDNRTDECAAKDNKEREMNVGLNLFCEDQPCDFNNVENNQNVEHTAKSIPEHIDSKNENQIELDRVFGNKCESRNSKTIFVRNPDENDSNFKTMCVSKVEKKDSKYKTIYVSKPDANIMDTMNSGVKLIMIGKSCLKPGSGVEIAQLNNPDTTGVKSLKGVFKPIHNSNPISKPTQIIDTAEKIDEIRYNVSSCSQDSASDDKAYKTEPVDATPSHIFNENTIDQETFISDTQSGPDLSTNTTYSDKSVHVFLSPNSANKHNYPVHVKTEETDVQLCKDSTKILVHQLTSKVDNDSYHAHASVLNDAKTLGEQIVQANEFLVSQLTGTERKDDVKNESSENQIIKSIYTKSPCNDHFEGSGECDKNTNHEVKDWNGRIKKIREFLDDREFLVERIELEHSYQTKLLRQQRVPAVHPLTGLEHDHPYNRNHVKHANIFDAFTGEETAVPKPGERPYLIFHSLTGQKTLMDLRPDEFGEDSSGNSCELRIDSVFSLAPEAEKDVWDDFLSSACGEADCQIGEKTNICKCRSTTEENRRHRLPNHPFPFHSLPNMNNVRITKDANDDKRLRKRCYVVLNRIKFSGLQISEFDNCPKSCRLRIAERAERCRTNRNRQMRYHLNMRLVKYMKRKQRHVKKRPRTLHTQDRSGNDFACSSLDDVINDVAKGKYGSSVGCSEDVVIEYVDDFEFLTNCDNENVNNFESLTDCGKDKVNENDQLLHENVHRLHDKNHSSSPNEIVTQLTVSELFRGNDEIGTTPCLRIKSEPITEGYGDEFETGNRVNLDRVKSEPVTDNCLEHDNDRNNALSENDENFTEIWSSGRYESTSLATENRNCDNSRMNYSIRGGDEEVALPAKVRKIENPSTKNEHNNKISNLKKLLKLKEQVVDEMRRKRATSDYYCTDR